MQVVDSRAGQELSRPYNVMPYGLLFVLLRSTASTSPIAHVNIALKMGNFTKLA